MNWLGAVLRTFGPRIIASIVGGIATYVGVKTSGAVQIDPTAAAEVVTGVLVTYAASHRAVSSIFNPGDAAKGRVAVAEKHATDEGGTVRVDREIP